MKTRGCVFSIFTIALFGCAPIINLSNCDLPRDDTWLEVSSRSKQLAEFFSGNKIRQRENAVWFINSAKTKVYACGLGIGKTTKCGSQDNIYIKKQDIISKENVLVVVCSSSRY